MFHTDLEHMFWGLYTMVLVSLQIKNLEVHYGKCKKIFSSPNFKSKLDQKDNQQFKENKMNDLKSINGEIITPANFSNKNLSYGIRRQANRDAQLAIAKTFVGQMKVQGKARLTQTAMMETSNLANTALTISQIYPDASPYVQHLLQAFVSGAANDIYNF